MATELDIEIIPIVTELLELYGKNATFTSPKATALNYTVATGAVVQPTQSDISWKVTPPEPWNKSYGEGTASREYLETYIAAEDITFTPAKGMTMKLESTSYRIENVDPIYSGELVALYKLMLKR